MSDELPGYTFELKIANFADKALKRVNLVKRGVAIRLFRAVIMDSPVDTGRLRANWIVSLRAPVVKQRSKVDPSGGEAITEVTRVISGSNLLDTIILTNSLPYVKRIEFDGWSHTKAPAGMVRKNVNRFRILLKENLNKLQDV